MAKLSHAELEERVAFLEAKLARPIDAGGCLYRWTECRYCDGTTGPDGRRPVTIKHEADCLFAGGGADALSSKHPATIRAEKAESMVRRVGLALLASTKERRDAAVEVIEYLSSVERPTCEHCGCTNCACVEETDA